jgi:ABC-type multidrug transport system fused ATPase/permease subunit
MRTDGVLPKGGGVGVTWSNVGYEVRPTHGGMWGRVVAWFKGSGGSTDKTETGEKIGPNGGKIILRDVHGHLPAGGFCAILGPSGAGKSTLVDVLAGKRKAGKVEGRVGFTRSNGEQGRVKIGYVDQVSLFLFSEADE